MSEISSWIWLFASVLGFSVNFYSQTANQWQGNILLSFCSSHIIWTPESWWIVSQMSHYIVMTLTLWFSYLVLSLNFCLFSICPMRLAVWFFPKDLPVLPASRLTQQPGMHLHTPKNLTPVAVPENDKLNNALKTLVQNCYISDSHQLKNDLLVWGA